MINTGSVDNDVFAWGDNEKGQLGIGSKEKSIWVPTKSTQTMDSGVKKIIGNQKFSVCLLNNGNLMVSGGLYGCSFTHLATEFSVKDAAILSGDSAKMVMTFSKEVKKSNDVFFVDLDTRGAILKKFKIGQDTTLPIAVFASRLVAILDSKENVYILDEEDSKMDEKSRSDPVFEIQGIKATAIYLGETFILAQNENKGTFAVLDLPHNDPNQKENGKLGVWRPMRDLEKQVLGSLAAGPDFLLGNCSTLVLKDQHDSESNSERQVDAHSPKAVEKGIGREEAPFRPQEEELDLKEHRIKQVTVRPIKEEDNSSGTPYLMKNVTAIQTQEAMQKEENKGEKHKKDIRELDQTFKKLKESYNGLLFEWKTPDKWQSNSRYLEYFLKLPSI